MSESEMNGSPITFACKHRVETAREVSPVGYKSVPCAENSFAPSLVGEAYAAGNRERGLPGRIDTPATCKVCGGPLDYVDASQTCTRCIERLARREESREALRCGYRQDRTGAWRRD
jgi:transcription initiation factor IIE alpha subunit